MSSRTLHCENTFFSLKLISNLWSNQEYTYLTNSYGDSWVHQSLNHCFTLYDTNDGPQRPYLPPEYWLIPALACLPLAFTSHSTSKYPHPLAWPQIPSIRDISRPNGVTASNLRGLTPFTIQVIGLVMKSPWKRTRYFCLSGLFVYIIINDNYYWVN